MRERARQLTELSEEERAKAYERYVVIRPYFEEGVSQVELARVNQVPLSTVRRWVRWYREEGLRGLARLPREDRGKRRDMPEEMIQVIEGLALSNPRRSIATIHRQVCEIARQQEWVEPSYGRVYQIIGQMSPALKLWAEKGAGVYREEYELLYRREAEGGNEIWQADHYRMPLWVKDETGQVGKPWLTVILDDYSRAIMGYRLSWSAPNAVQTVLTLRQAIWRKEEGKWSMCGIPQVLYTDHGSDFTSTQLEYVAGDLKMQVVYSQVGRPRGRGKIERFFRTVEQLFAEREAGYAPKGEWPKKGGKEPRRERAGIESLEEVEQRFRRWVIEEYHQREHGELGMSPKEKWEGGGFLPRMPESVEQLDLLLVTVAKKRRVQQDGVSFEGYRYMDPTLSAYVGEDVVLRYDPADLAEVRIFAEDRFVCRAVCPELAGGQVSLKEIVAARVEQRREVERALKERQGAVRRVKTGAKRGASEEKRAGGLPGEGSVEKEKPSGEEPGRVPLKRYFNE